MDKHRKQTRLRYFDYGNTGAYYVTICTHERKEILSAIDKENIHLTTIGRIVEEELQRTSSMRDNISLGEYVIMPNHIHIIMMFHDRTAVVLEEQPDSALRRFGGSHGGSLSSIIGNFKSAVTSRVRKDVEARRACLPPNPPEDEIKVWQRGFYEHIIRDEKDLLRITDYIMTNPITWHYDMENPNREMIALTQEGTRGVPLRNEERPDYPDLALGGLNFKKATKEKKKSGQEGMF